MLRKPHSAFPQASGRFRLARVSRDPPRVRQLRCHLNGRYSPCFRSETLIAVFILNAPNKNKLNNRKAVQGAYIRHCFALLKCAVPIVSRNLRGGCAGKSAQAGEFVRNRSIRWRKRLYFGPGSVRIEL
jgi:hypothetical protein